MQNLTDHRNITSAVDSGHKALMLLVCAVFKAEKGHSQPGKVEGLLRLLPEKNLTSY